MTGLQQFEPIGARIQMSCHERFSPVAPLV